MADSFSVDVSTGPLFALSHAMREAEKQCLRLSGTIYANALRTLTPPHGKGSTMADTAKAKSKGITALRGRIAEDLMGGPAPTKARPVLKADGTWLAFDASGHYTSGGGNYGMVVATKKKFGPHTVPVESPESVVASLGTVVKKQKGAMRRWRARQDGVHFVAAGALRAFVRKRQAKAGFTISGWRHGARFFSTGKNIAKGFFEPLGGSGSAGQSADPASTSFADVEPLEGWMANDAFHGPLQQRDRIQNASVHRVAGNALKKMRAEILKWYTKKANQILK